MALFAVLQREETHPLKKKKPNTNWCVWQLQHNSCSHTELSFPFIAPHWLTSAVSGRK